MVLFGFLRRAALAIVLLAGAPALVLGGAILAASSAQAAPLASVQVSGNARIDSATIRSYVTVDYGENFGQSDLNDTFGVLFATGFFADVEVTGSGSTIYIVVVENPVVVQISFAGNRRVRDPELIELVQTEIRGVLSDSVLAADVRRIEGRYAQQGRGAVIIDVEIQRLDGNLANVIFHITEGERVKIASITFEGNDAFSDRQLEAVIETRESGLLTWITKDDAYSFDRLLLDRELLRRHYLERGYADFQILAVDVVYDEENFRYAIVFIVSEGPLYRFGAISVDSTLPGITGDTLARAIHTRSGRVFNAIDLERTLEDIAVLLANAGEPFTRVTPLANRNYVENTIDITYQIDPGPRVHIERITIIGNTRTRDYVIRHEFDMAEGDAYNRVLIDRVERRLLALGIFQSVDIQVQQGSGPDQVVLIVYIEERSTGEVNFVVGYSTADRILGEISLNEANFLGRGQHLRLAFTVGLKNRNYSISFTEPYFLGRRLPFGFDLYRRTTTASVTRPFGEQQNGGQLRVALPLTHALTAQFAYAFVSQVVSGSTQSDIYPNGTTLTSSVSITLVYSTIDDMNDPRQGIFIRARGEYAGLGGTNSFVRSTLDARLYQPLGYQSSIVGLLRFQAGNITGIGQQIRVVDHFVLGGDTIRGFAAAGFGPRTTDGTGLPLGGRNYWAATAEVSFPLPLVPEDNGFRGAVFADAGMLWGVDAPLPGATPFVSDMILRASVGASLMWASPIGILRLDVAKVLSSAGYDATQLVRFGVGTQF